MVDGQNRHQEWTLRPRRVQMNRFHDWAAKNLKHSDAVVIETTGSVCDIYDIVAPLVGVTQVANARKIRQICRGQSEDRQERY